MVKKQVWLVVVLIGVLVMGHATLAQDELTETFASSDGTLTFDYPAKWFVEEFGQDGWATVSLFNGQAPYTGPFELKPGEIVLTFMHPRLIWEALPMLEPHSTLTEIGLMLANQPDDDSPIDLSLRRFAEYEALQSITSTADGDIILWIVDLGDNYMAITAVTPESALALQNAALWAILDSLAYHPGEQTATFATSDGVLTFDYPAGWYAGEEDTQIFGQFAVIYNVPGATEDDLVDWNELAAGELLMTILPPSVTEMLYSDIFAAPTLADVSGIIAATAETEVTSELITIQGQEALKVVANLPGEGDITQFIMDTPDGYLLILVFAPPGEMVAHEMEVRALLETLIYTPLPE